MGLAPEPFTLRALVAMANARRKDEWDRAALLAVLLAEPHRDKKKRPRPYDVSDFSPFEDEQQTKPGLSVKSAGIGALKVFAKKK